MEVVEVSRKYEFENKEKYLPNKWKIIHIIFYLICSLIGIFGSCLVRILEYDFDQECIYEAMEYEHLDWFAVPNLSVWSNSCYAISFIFIVSFVFGMIWTVYFFICSITQYRSRARYQMEDIESYGPPQRLVIPALIFNIAMSVSSGIIAFKTRKDLMEVCRSLMENTSSGGCRSKSRSMYYPGEMKTLSNAKQLVLVICVFGIAQFIAWLMNSLLMLLRILLAPDYILMQEVTVEFDLKDQPNKKKAETFKERLEIWKNYIKENGFRQTVLQSVQDEEMRITRKFLEEELDHEIDDELFKSTMRDLGFRSKKSSISLYFDDEEEKRSTCIISPEMSESTLGDTDYEFTSGKDRLNLSSSLINITSKNADEIVDGILHSALKLVEGETKTNKEDLGSSEDSIRSSNENSREPKKNEEDVGSSEDAIRSSNETAREPSENMDNAKNHRND